MGKEGPLITGGLWCSPGKGLSWEGLLSSVRGRHMLLGRVGVSRVMVSCRDVTGGRHGVSVGLGAKGCREVAEMRVRRGFIANRFVP